MQNKIIIGYANPVQIKDFHFIKTPNKEAYISLNLRQTNLYVDTFATLKSETGGGGLVWKEDKELKKYKVTIERIK